MKWFVTNALAGFMDFGVGTLIAAITGIWFGGGVSIWFRALGGIFALLPDFDLIRSILRKKVVGNHHLTLMHRPLILLPIATVSSSIVGWIVGIPSLGVTTLLCVLWHYIHDSPECGGSGIAWLSPFSQKMFSLRGKHIHQRALPPDDHACWLIKTWSHPSTVSVREITIGSLCLIVASLLAMPAYWWLGLLVVAGVWVAVLTLWMSTQESYNSIS